jgi:hypothetical protein
MHSTATAQPQTERDTEHLTCLTSERRSELKSEVERLAKQAFYRHLISGYGTGEYPDEYQIVYQGKPRHFSLEYAHRFLQQLMGQLYPPALM